MNNISSRHFNGNRTGELTIPKRHPIDAHETPDWIKSAREAFDPTDDLESLFTREEPAADPDEDLYTAWPDPRGVEVGLDPQTLRNAQAIAPAFDVVQADQITKLAQQLVQQQWKSGILIIPRNKRIYMICDSNQRMIYNLALSIRDLRRLAVCSCGSVELCDHVLAVLPLHISLAHARKTIGAETESFLESILFELKRTLYLRSYREMSENAWYYALEARRRRAALQQRYAEGVR